MCGIIAVIAKNGNAELARESMLDQYQSQHSRGNRGFGLIEVMDKGTVRVRRATEPIKATIDITRSEAGILLFHHRMPTSTENTLQQTHPILVSHEELTGDWLVCHNGVIRNTKELKEKHEKLGYKYTTLTQARHSAHFTEFNDSEAMAIELVRVLEGKQDAAEWAGAAAFIGIKISKKTGKAMHVMFGKGEFNPLQYKETEDCLIIASDIPGENVFEVPDKHLGLITLKSIGEPKKWPVDTDGFASLYDMAFTTDLILKPLETPIVVSPYSSTYGPNRGGGGSAHLQNQRNTQRTLGLLNPGRTGGKDDERDYGHAVVRLPSERSDNPTEEEVSPRMKAFYVMADRVTDQIANVINGMFINLSENEIDDKELFGYMKEIEIIIKDRFKNAERARYHLDRMEDNYNQQDLQNEHMKSLSEPIKEEVIAG